MFIQVIDIVPQLYPNSFYAAIPIVEAIVTNEGFYNIISDLYPLMNIDCARNIINEGFKVDSISLKADFDAYACVYVGVEGRESDYATIYFNPLLMLASKRLEIESESHVFSAVRPSSSLEGKQSSEYNSEEVTQPFTSKKRPAISGSSSASPDKRSRITETKETEKDIAEVDEVAVRLTMFFVIKLVHEISHVLNFHCNPELKCNRTPPKKPAKECRYKFVDFGDMIEYRLFSGVFEHHEESSAMFKRGFSVRGIVRYEFPGAPEGVRVAWKRNQLSVSKDMTWTELMQRLQPSIVGDYEAASTGNRKKLLVPISKASVASDYYGDELEEYEGIPVGKA
jgi:hypothetical protein